MVHGHDRPRPRGLRLRQRVAQPVGLLLVGDLVGVQHHDAHRPDPVDVPEVRPAELLEDLVLLAALVVVVAQHREQLRAGVGHGRERVGDQLVGQVGVTVVVDEVPQHQQRVVRVPSSVLDDLLHRRALCLVARPGVPGHRDPHGVRPSIAGTTSPATAEGFPRRRGCGRAAGRGQEQAVTSARSTSAQVRNRLRRLIDSASLAGTGALPDPGGECRARVEADSWRAYRRLTTEGTGLSAARAARPRRADRPSRG